MSMRQSEPSMDVAAQEAAEIEMQIEQELLQLDVHGAGTDDNEDEDGVGDGDAFETSQEELPSFIHEYVNSMHKQTENFQLELEECDNILELINSARTARANNTDMKLWKELAQETGEEPEMFRSRVLAEIEQEDQKYQILPDQKDQRIESIDNANENKQNVKDNNAMEIDEKAPPIEDVQETDIEIGEQKDAQREIVTSHVLQLQSVENLVEQEEAICSFSVVPEENKEEGTVSTDSTVVKEQEKSPQPDEEVVAEIFDADILESQGQEKLLQLELRYQQRETKRRKAEDQTRQAEQEATAAKEEERRRRRLELEEEQSRQEQLRKVEEDRITKEMEKMQMEAEEELKAYQAEIEKLAQQVQEDAKIYQLSLAEKQERCRHKENSSAVMIQKIFRGYRVKKLHGSAIQEKIKELRKKQEQTRIKEIEQEQEKERQKKEEEEKQKKAEIQRKEKKEYERLQRIEEERRIEKQKIEEQKREEEKRKEMEKQRKLQELEEKRKKEEEEKQRLIEEVKRKEAEKQRLEIERERKKVEEEKQRLIKEAQKKEAEKQKLVELEKQRKRLNEEKQRQIEEAKKKETEKQRLLEKEKQRKAEKEEQRKEEENIENLEDENQEDMQQEDQKHKRQNMKLKNKTQLEKGCEEVRDNQAAKDKISAERVLVEKQHAHARLGEKEETITGEGNLGTSTKDDSLAKAEEDSKVSQNGMSTLNTKNRFEGWESPNENEKHTTSVSVPWSSSAVKPMAKKDQSKEKSVDRDQEKTLEVLRLTWMESCKPWSKISHETKVNKPASKKPLRRPSSAKKLPILDADRILSASGASALSQVTTVELHELPGCNIHSLGQCIGLKALKIVDSAVVAIDGLEACKNLKYLNMKNNNVEMVNLRDLHNLVYVNLSGNKLSSIHGFEGCENLRFLDVTHNKITRIAGLGSLRRLHTLKASHNQLITSRGLGLAVSLQWLDLSHNHLPVLEDVDMLCLLQHLDASSNNLLQIPKLFNQVLLRQMVLDDNSISFLDPISECWLPLLVSVSLNQNSISHVPCLDNLLLLKELNLGHNQLLDFDCIKSGLASCLSLKSLSLAGNPVAEEQNCREFLSGMLPQLLLLDDRPVRDAAASQREKHSTQMEQTYRNQLVQHDKLNHAYTKHLQKHSIDYVKDLQKLYHIHLAYFEKSNKLAVEHRFAHEYGDLTSYSCDLTHTDENTESLDLSKLSFKSDISHSKENYSNTTKDMKNLFEAAVGKANLQSNGSTPSEDPFLPKPPSGEKEQRSYSSRKFNKQDEVAKAGGSTTEKSSDGVAVKADVVNQILKTRHTVEKQILVQEVAAIKIQAFWRGYRVRRDIDSQAQLFFDTAATKIQAAWRGYSFRKKLMNALSYAKFEDEDEFTYNEVDLGDFDFSAVDQLDHDWAPPATPQLPINHPVLGKGQVKLVPSLFQPEGPKQAWRNVGSPFMGDTPVPLGKPPLPPGSRMSQPDTHRTGLSKKSEQLSEEWGFHSNQTAELMMKRTRKMKYDALKRQKLSKLDAHQRLALMRKLEQSNKVLVQKSPARKQLPRKEYFQAKMQEAQRKTAEKSAEQDNKVRRTFEWLHTQVGNHEVSSSRINQGAERVYGSDSNLPLMDAGVLAGAPARLTASPSLELQSVESSSFHGDAGRRHSFSNNSGDKVVFPPIKTSSAPSNHGKEKMSWRNPVVNQSVGWGGGKKRMTTKQK